jgi:hypothetical protein
VTDFYSRLVLTILDFHYFFLISNYSTSPQIIHTSKLSKEYRGDADFWPNGGDNQPYCQDRHKDRKNRDDSSSSSRSDSSSSSLSSSSSEEDQRRKNNVRDSRRKQQRDSSSSSSSEEDRHRPDRDGQKKQKKHFKSMEEMLKFAKKNKGKKISKHIPDNEKKREYSYLVV